MARTRSSPSKSDDFATCPFLQLGIQEDKPAKTVTPVTGPFRTPAVRAEPLEEIWQFGPHAQQDCGQLLRIIHLRERSSDNTLMAYRIPIVSDLHPMEIAGKIICKDRAMQALPHICLQLRRKDRAEHIENLRHEIGRLGAEEIDLHRILPGDIVYCANSRGQGAPNLLLRECPAILSGQKPPNVRVRGSDSSASRRLIAARARRRRRSK